MGSGHAKAYRGLQTAWPLAMGVLLVWQACLTGLASVLHLNTLYTGSAVELDGRCRFWLLGHG